MVHEIPETEFVYKLFRKKLLDKCPFLSEMKLYRMYINCFAPCENPYFHTDGKGLTFLYYINDDWNLQDGGETQFYVDGNIYGITPIPNRLVMFDGMIPHRATSFRNRHRFTIAIKYE
jgi:Rps23 Pro-64 3,4-dihydroxylase Tpa1-like proline 4-hydroxylase